ncbi:NUDIX hydrolase [Aquipuribacter sp. MA13-6]|uniref:NUDIX hydrolase n=1 Tax=unclassified Aquipuribacter TaxID=2635084 RepID=UPI003EE85829
MTDTPKHSVSVAGVVVDDQGRVLVIQRRDNGKWEPPGGVLELDETLEAGVRREVLEETGVDVKVGPLTGAYKNMTRGIVNIVFRCTPHSRSASPTDQETQQLRWLPAEDAAALMEPAYAARILDAFSPTPHRFERMTGRVCCSSRRTTP